MTTWRQMEIEYGSDVEFNPQLPKDNPLAIQVDGKHYKNMAIQPVEFIHKNNIPFIEGCCVKYLCRWRDKGGVKDLEKVKHFVDILIELEKNK